MKFSDAFSWKKFLVLLFKIPYIFSKYQLAVGINLDDVFAQNRERNIG